MKLYSFCNKSYDYLKNIFLESCQDNYEMIIEEIDVEKTVGVHSKKIWTSKTKKIIDAIEKNHGQKIIFCDIDIQFFKPTQPLIDSSPDVDILFQFENGKICIGFMVIKCNDATKNFFIEVLERCERGEWDQHVIREKTKENKISWAFLPKEIWCYLPEDSTPPANIACHHATCAFTLEEKIEQMNSIRYAIKNTNKSKFYVFLLCYNEEVLLPHTISHYKKLLPTAEFTIFDHSSTDKSVEIARSLGCNVFSYNTKNNQIDDFKYIKIKNNCWKFIDDGWVIVCDMDEWLCVDEDSLIKEQQKGNNIIQVEGFNIIADSKCEDLSDINLHKQKNGLEHGGSCKKVCFRPDKIKEINYSIGAHNCKPEGDIKISDSKYMLKHMSLLGLPFVLKRHAIRRARSAEMWKYGHAGHYAQTDEKVKETYDLLKNKSKSLFHLCPECFGFAKE